MTLLQRNIRNKITLGQDGNSLVFLFVTNIILFIVFGFVKVLYLVNDSTEDAFRAQVFSWLSVPAQPSVFATRPWTLITYMFSHFGIWDLFSSMAWLWCFGHILQTISGNRRLVPVYLYGGFAAAVVFLLAVNLIPALRVNVNSVYPLLGGGPAVMAIAIAATTLVPNYRIFPMINFPLWALTAVFGIIRIGSVGPGGYGQAIALMAGGLMGFVFAFQLQKGNDWGQWMSDVVNWFENLFNPYKKNYNYSPKEELFYKANQKPFEKTPHVTQQRVDDLLDKINGLGYHSLTDEEKAFLKNASREEL